jgi:hypothetical protein
MLNLLLAARVGAAHGVSVILQQVQTPTINLRPITILHHITTLLKQGAGGQWR